MPMQEDTRGNYFVIRNQKLACKFVEALLRTLVLTVIVIFVVDTVVIAFVAVSSRYTCIPNHSATAPLHCKLLVQSVLIIMLIFFYTDVAV